ncbi:polysaccharide pyruvyl transferase family protein [Candidatus Sumerlaeota bacterium]|nr:polysaccharide pyruvyl transferase family protein [Candidatus Sumerlaeota bacterium]
MTAATADPHPESHRDENATPQTATDAPRVCVLGASLDTGNMGCTALTVSVVRLIHEALPEARILLLYGHREGGPRPVRVAPDTTVTAHIVNFRLSPRARPREHLAWILLCALLYRFVPLRVARRAICRVCPWIDALSTATVVGEINGGDSFSDIYGIKNFVIRVLPTLAAILVHGRLLLLPQTYGPYRSLLSRVVARYILRRSDTILSRDAEGIGVVQNLLPKKAFNIRFCPDVAFALEPCEPADPRPSKMMEKGAGERLVGLNVSGLLYSSEDSPRRRFRLGCEYRDMIGDLARSLLTIPKTRIVLIPHTFSDSQENDRNACRELVRSVGDGDGRVALLDGDLDPNELKWAIGKCDFFIGSRMHACIAALSQGVPCAALAYSGKFRGVFESVASEDTVVDLRSTPAESVVSRCLDSVRESDDLRRRLAGPSQEIRRPLFDCFKACLRQRSDDPGASRDA